MSYCYKFKWSMIIRPTISNYSSCSLSPQQYNTVILNTTTLNASQYTIYSSNNSILISRSMNTSSNIGVTNVKNPSSAISTYSFTISSKNANDSISPSIYNTTTVSIDVSRYRSSVGFFFFNLVFQSYFSEFG